MKYKSKLKITILMEVVAVELGKLSKFIDI